jgi:hypothetical protein
MNEEERDRQYIARTVLYLVLRHDPAARIVITHQHHVDLSICPIGAIYDCSCMLHLYP